MSNEEKLEKITEIYDRVDVDTEGEPSVVEFGRIMAIALDEIGQVLRS